ncbi:hypothetical protein [Bacillus alkalicola]|uniref:Uncharacterized protein n=1 Tax=Evansella alkalicola TaxID=745819 RepID=A0ABS6K116_9BACI|nr:hypothetical protein [Bacillus alkalicola]MBU9723147.1 hypothetical protein [Bacillus alkalicola]
MNDKTTCESTIICPILVVATMASKLKGKVLEKLNSSASVKDTVLFSKEKLFLKGI